MAEISFKSVGIDVTSRQNSTRADPTPIGIKTPLQLGQKNDGIFAMHFSNDGQVQDNLRNLLLTNWGERLAFYDYGANLKELTMEIVSERFDLEAMTRIKRAVNKWMPYVELSSFEKVIVGREKNSSVTQIKLRINYNVPKLGILNKMIEVTLFVAG